ncbi:hypothetical protein MASR2M15_12880 [Anaerolineales bacterium]
MIDYHDLADHLSLYPFPITQNHLQRLADTLSLSSQVRLLDLSCGKGELLCQWAQKYELKGLGVDNDEEKIKLARERATELEVWSEAHFVSDTVSDFPQEFHEYDVVLSLGGAYHWPDHLSALKSMQEALTDAHAGMLVLGDFFWKQEPDPQTCQKFNLDPSELNTLTHLTQNFHEAGLLVMNIIIADQVDWDEYYSQQWLGMMRWLHRHPETNYDPIIKTMMESQRKYLEYERELISWGIFVLTRP